MKKKNKIFLIALFMSITVQGQITKGNWLVGGNASYSSTQSENAVSTTTTNRKSLTAEPDIGYFFFDKFAAGVKGLINYENVSYNQVNSNSSTYYGVGPFVRYYFLPTEKQLNVFSEGSYEYYLYKPGNAGANNYTFLVGAETFFNSSAGIEFTAGYSISKNSSQITYKTFQLGIGFQIHLEK